MLDGSDIVDHNQDFDSKAKVKAKRYPGLLEWILDREGHEFLVGVDRAFLKDKGNLVHVKETFEEYQAKQLTDNQFWQYVRHLYKAKAPSPEQLQDEKYLQFIQDAVDIYGLIHKRYIQTEEGKSHSC